MDRRTFLQAGGLAVIAAALGLTGTTRASTNSQTIDIPIPREVTTVSIVGIVVAQDGRNVYAELDGHGPILVGRMSEPWNAATLVSIHG